MSIIRDIKGYIEFLNNELSLDIAIHPKEFEELVNTSELLRFNIHTNPYCLFLKRNTKILEKCIDCQQKVFEHCKNGEFEGICHAGVFEYIYPFKRKDKIIGFISVTGYQATNPTINDTFSNLCSTYNISSKELADNYYGNLKTNIPPKSKIDALLKPLCYMLEIAYSQSPDITKEQSKGTNFYSKILYYLNQNHCSQISVDDICRELYCSKSYVSHIFKKYNGKTIKEYLNTIRIKDAQTLLTNSNLNMTQIALSLGFTNSNYFAITFKNHTGISPTEYRKKHK